MKLQGNHTFQSAPSRVFAALLEPLSLQATIPGCVAVWYPQTDHMKVRLTLPLSLPGLEGPYDVTVRVRDQQPPHTLVLVAERKGRIGGSVQALTHLHFTPLAQAAGTSTTMSYEATVDLSGPIAAANNPLLQQVVQHQLNTFLNNLDDYLCP